MIFLLGVLLAQVLPHLGRFWAIRDSVKLLAVTHFNLLNVRWQISHHAIDILDLSVEPHGALLLPLLEKAVHAGHDVVVFLVVGDADVWRVII